MSQPLEERAVAGLHRFVIERVLVEHAPVPAAAVDLGAGSGALASRLRSLGWDVVAVERDVDNFRADVPVVRWDLDATDLPPELDGRRFDLVVATEVIEHMESPIAFLRKVRALLDDHGVAILTTPNVDSALARLKFLARDRLRMMDAAGDPTHISPIFLDLLLRQYLPRADLTLVARYAFPSGGFAVSRHWVSAAGRLSAAILPGAANTGDNHVLLLVKRGGFDR